MAVIWTICDGEPLPIDEGAPRLLRTAILSQLLADREHELTYWTSRFDHLRKTLRMPTPSIVDSGLGYKINCVDAFPYKRNISLGRLKHNRIVVRDMEARMRAEKRRPDLIVADLPTIELAELAGRLGQEWKIPVVISIRDLWPDVFFNLLPSNFHWLGPILFSKWNKMARRACRLATSIIGISPNYLEWGIKRADRAIGPDDAMIPLGYPDRYSDGVCKTSRAKLESYGVDFSRQIVCFVGTFGRSYDLGTVIEAARTLLPHSRAQFVLCGDGERKVKWKDQAKNLPNVLFTDWLDKAEIATLLEGSTLGLAAYSSGAKQGLPNKFFEYMSFGLPVVSSLNGEAADEIISYKFGQNYKAKDSVQLAQVLKEILADQKSLNQMAVAAQVRFDNNYRQSIVYQNYIDLVERMLANRLQVK